MRGLTYKKSYFKVSQNISFVYGYANNMIGSSHSFCFRLLVLAFQIYFGISLCRYYIKYIHGLKAKSLRQRTFR